MKEFSINFHVISLLENEFEFVDFKNKNNWFLVDCIITTED